MVYVFSRLSSGEQQTLLAYSPQMTITTQHKPYPESKAYFQKRKTVVDDFVCGPLSALG